MTETWLPIPGFPGYEVSDLGRVRSLIRDEPRLLATWANKWGHLKARVGGRAGRARYVHQLVLEAFVGPRPDGMVARHLDGNPANNTPGNLAWGTVAENNADAVRHGTHYEATRTHCPRGHAYNKANTRHYRGMRTCRACARERMARVRRNKRQDVAA